MSENYKANFLWPHEDGSLEQLGYEFANANTEEYREEVWKEIVARLSPKAPNDAKKTTNYKALPIQSVGDSTFAIAISDNYVTWEYPINISEHMSIHEVHEKICVALGCEKEDGRIMKY